MFLSSMAPLLIVFALLDTFGSSTASVLCIALALMSVVGHFLLLAMLSRDQLGTATHEHAHEIANAEERGSDVMAYVATYLIPFVGFKADDLRSAAALAIFLLVIGALYVRSGLFAINPGLAIVGFHLYRAELKLADGSSRSTNLLIRASIPPGSVTLRAHQLGPDLLIAFGKDYQRGTQH
jgi:hypothetical protein